MENRWMVSYWNVSYTVLDSRQEATKQSIHWPIQLRIAIFKIKNKHEKRILGVLSPIFITVRFAKFHTYCCHVLTGFLYFGASLHLATSIIPADCKMALAGLNSSSILSGVLLDLKRAYPLVQSVRFWRERPEYTRRHGFKVEHHITGPLPRIKVAHDLRPLPTKPHPQKDSWTQRKATFGQNDYIDILGDGSLHPRDLLHHGPSWLRGFRGNEFRRLIRRRDATFHYAPWVWPTKFYNVQRRLRFLHKYINYQCNHKDWRNKEWAIGTS